MLKIQAPLRRFVEEGRLIKVQLTSFVIFITVADPVLVTTVLFILLEDHLLKLDVFFRDYVLFARYFELTFFNDKN